MKVIYFFTIVLVSLLILGGCNMLGNQELSVEELKTLISIDQIQVLYEDSSTGESHLIKVITDTKRIDSIIATFSSYSDGWQYEYPYAKPGPLRVKFFNDEKQKIEVMVGYYRKSTDNIRFYLSIPFGPGKTLSYGEFKDIIDTLEVDEKLAKN